MVEKNRQRKREMLSIKSNLRAFVNLLGMFSLLTDGGFNKMQSDSNHSFIIFSIMII